MKRPHQSIQIFKNPYLERLTHVHPIMPLVVWVPIILFLYYRSIFVLRLSATQLGVMTALGLFSWTLSEYVLHKFVFHFKPKGYFQERLQFLIHGNHHDDPNDPTRLVMPPAGSLILGMILFSVFRGVFSLLGSVDLVFPFFAAFCIGYLCYDYIHYGVHHFTPTSRLGKHIKQNHMLHHYAHPELYWGVSSPLWDIILGTRASGAGTRASGGAKAKVQAPGSRKAASQAASL